VYKRYPVLTFYAVVFAISWGGFLLVIGGPGRIPGASEQIDRLLPGAMLVWFAGPSIAGVLLTGLVHGRAGLRDLLARMTRWQVGARWYALVLLATPLLYMTVLFALSLLSPEFLPNIVTSSDKVSVLLFGIVGGLIGGGLLEEPGWTGFAVPELRRRYGPLRRLVLDKARAALAVPAEEADHLGAASLTAHGDQRCASACAKAHEAHHGGRFGRLCGQALKCVLDGSHYILSLGQASRAQASFTLTVAAEVEEQDGISGGVEPLRQLQQVYHWWVSRAVSGL
jgi:membrane protease YdiL (CAAX protease family)